MQCVQLSDSQDPSSFGFAGTKDRRGCTTQLVTVYRTYENQLLRALLEKRWDQQIAIEPVKFVKKKNLLAHKHSLLKLKQLRSQLLLKQVRVEKCLVQSLQMI